MLERQDIVAWPSESGWRCAMLATASAAGRSGTRGRAIAADGSNRLQPRAAPEPADLMIANRRIFTMRAEGFGTAPPSARAKAVSENIGLMVEQGGPLRVHDPGNCRRASPC